jgi:hypothetical protein
MKLPRARPEGIRLGGRQWRFRFRRPGRMAGIAGRAQLAQSLLDISEGQSPTDEADTVLHEVFHAILYCQGRENGGKVEETYVRALSTGLMAALHDNPQFAQWLLGTIPK